MVRIDDLAALLRDDSAALVTSEHNCFYLTGFDSENGWLMVTKRGSLYLTDSRYIEAAKQQIKGCAVELQNKIFEQMGRFAASHGITEILIEGETVSVLSAAKFKAALSDFDFNYTNELDMHISDLRQIKDAEEKDRITKAQRIAEQAFESTLKVIRPGITERNIAAELEYKMRVLGGDGASFDTIAITGVNTSKPHGVPGDAQVASGDFVTLDFGAKYKGYHSDTTRTVAVGNITPEMQHIYDIVLRAQQAGVEAVVPGLPTAEADSVCRDIITAAGYGPAFGHSTGHGVGVEIHEPPILSCKATDVLQPGNIITIEPGIYLEGKFGVRIEDMLYITESTAENLVKLPKELITLPV